MNKSTPGELMERLRHEHIQALEQAACGDSPFMHYLDQYFDHTGRWSRELADSGYILVPVPMVQAGEDWIAAPNVMYEYNQASDNAPTYLRDWSCDGCSAEDGEQHCGAALMVCGRLLLADLLERELVKDGS